MSKPLRALGAALSVPVLLLATACGTGAQPSGDEPGQLTIVTAFYPFQFVSERVAGASAEVVSLTTPGADPHDLELSPGQLIDISEADLVVYQSGFQPAVDEAVAQQGPEHVIDVAQVVRLQPVPEHEHGEEGHEEHEEEAGEEGHDHGDTDPHAWLDPENMQMITEAVATELAAVSPDDAAAFQTEADELVADLEQLDSDFSEGLQTCERREFITSHAAFGYLATRYDLTQIGISGISPDAEPSPARLAEIHTEAEEHGVTTIFTETLASPALAEAVAGDLGLRTDVLDPLEGLNGQSRGSDYIAVQQANLEALRTAGGCS
ncbi:metal ABC transporter substrate-binding protein [Auraticoccus monumenti]|uniref:Zinc transport system substrate-binding protein n=1 Tax=Auraticoccus monumenti TaxID=675864 RepID=A0A1G7ED68_9ACTN|nr:metal ABC transporter substrate-binding protein [Auraticoccus monumenti]SDE61547.1 zinc transport system substrate-binding protein [Auraticoccus monumenti]